MTETPDIRKGLAGVIVDTTSISKVNAETNSLLYRGCSGAGSRREVHLRGGRLPAVARRAAHPGSSWPSSRTLERSLQHLQPVVKRVIDELPLTAHPMDVSAPRQRHRCQ